MSQGYFTNGLLGMLGHELEALEKEKAARPKRRTLNEDKSDEKEFKVEKKAFWETLAKVLPETVTVKYISDPNKSSMGTTMSGYDVKDDEESFKMMGKDEEKSEGISIDKTKIKATYFKFDPHVKSMFDACVDMKDGDKFLFMDLGNEAAWDSLRKGELMEEPAPETETTPEENQLEVPPAEEPTPEPTPEPETPVEEPAAEPVKESVRKLNESNSSTGSGYQKDLRALQQKYPMCYIESWVPEDFASDYGSDDGLVDWNDPRWVDVVGSLERSFDANHGTNWERIASVVDDVGGLKESVSIEEAKKKTKKKMDRDCPADEMDEKKKPKGKKAKLKSLKESFMKPMVNKGKYWEVETTHGIFIVPEDVAGGDAVKDDLVQYVEGDITGEPELKDGWYGRMSADGYLDATDWIAGNSEEDVRQELDDMYGEDDGEGDPDAVDEHGEWNHEHMKPSDDPDAYGPALDESIRVIEESKKKLKVKLDKKEAMLAKLKGKKKTTKPDDKSGKTAY